MSLVLFDRPKVLGTYLFVGTYDNRPIYVGERPSKEWVAAATTDGEGVCINNEAFAALRRSPKAREFLQNICEHELRKGPVHDDTGDRPDFDNEILQYLAQQGILK